MFRLLTLGGLLLESSEREGSPIPLRPQGLAILARLAIAGERGLSREKLIADFWPEKDERHALHSLSQALHQIRRVTAPDALILGTRILRLNVKQIWSDVGALEDAMRAGDSERAVHLYAGAFLDGIFVVGAPDFEVWADGERRRLAGDFRKCVRGLAMAAESANDHRGAADWWRRLAIADPLDGDVATHLVIALAAAGDRRGAAREARQHQALVMVELPGEVDPRLQALIAEQGLCGDVDDGPRVRTPSQGDLPRDIDDANALGPEELIARARQCMHAFTRDRFIEGIHYCERAVQRDANNAQGYATLAWLYVILSQAEKNGDPRAKAVRCARRAADLDPTLADALLSRAWAAQLDYRFEEGEALASRGVEIDPEGLLGHSVLAWVRMNWGLKRGRWDKCSEGMPSFARTLQIHPRDPAILIAVGALYTLAAQYHVAQRLLEFGVEIERWPAGEMRMIGTQTLLGHLHLHRGRELEARRCFDGAIESYAGAPQLFAPYVHALTLCGLGDVERLSGRYDVAVTHYARARATIESVPALMGCGYLAIRLETRLAGAFRRLRMRSEELRHAEAARALAATPHSYSFNWCWGVSEAEMFYDWAVYEAICSHRVAMLESLGKAVSYGWRETTWLRLEPGFERYRSDSALLQLLDEAHRRPPLPEYQYFETFATVASKTDA